METHLALGCGKQCEYAAISTGRGLRAELSDAIGAAQSQLLFFHFEDDCWCWLVHENDNGDNCLTVQLVIIWPLVLQHLSKDSSSCSVSGVK